MAELRLPTAQLELIPLPKLLVFWENDVQTSLDIFEHGESQSNIQYNSAQSWDSSLVESPNSFVLEDADEAIDWSLVLIGLKSLHVGLDDINWSVG